LLICLQINQQTIAGKLVARKTALTGGLRTFGLGVVAESLGLSGGDLLELEPARPPRAGFFVDAVEVQVVPEA
jgi:hypothetical protein